MEETSIQFEKSLQDHGFILDKEPLAYKSNKISTDHYYIAYNLPESNGHWYKDIIIDEDDMIGYIGGILCGGMFSGLRVYEIGPDYNRLYSFPPDMCVPIRSLESSNLELSNSEEDTSGGEENSVEKY